MKHLNFFKLLFIPLVCTGLTAGAQSIDLNEATTPNGSFTAASIKNPTSYSFFKSSQNSAQSQVAFKSNAAEGSSSTFSFGLELEALAPLGSFKDVASPGVGANIVGLYHLSDAGAITASAGYNFFIPNDNVDVNYSAIPVKVGYLAKLGGTFFIEPQIGIYSLRAADENDNSSTSTNLLLAGKIGVNIGEKSHLGIGYNYVKVDGGSYAFAGLSYLFTF